MSIAKLQLFSLWRVDPHQEGHERDLLLKLYKYLRAAAGYLEIPITHIEAQLSQRMTLKDAIATICPQLGIGTLELSRFEVGSIDKANLPMLACSLNKDFVLLLPRPDGKFVVFEGLGTRSQILTIEDISKRFLNIICLFRKADTKKIVNIADLNNFVKCFMPNVVIIGLSFLKIILLAIFLFSLALANFSDMLVNIFAVLQINIVCFIGIFLIDYFIAVCSTKNWPLVELWSLSALYGRAFSQSLSSYQNLCWRDLWELRLNIKQSLKSYFLGQYQSILAWAFLIANLLIFLVFKQFYLILILLVILGFVLFCFRKEESFEQHELDLLLNSIEKSFAMARDLNAQNYIINRLEQLCNELANFHQKISLKKAIKSFAKWIFSLFFVGISLSINFGIDNFFIKLLIIFDAIILGQALAVLLNQGRPKKPFESNIANALNLMQGYVGHKLQATQIEGNIELLGLSFAYPESSSLLFNNYNLSIGAGRCYVLCGPSGSGKSSLLKLLMGFYAPNTGYVIIDGQDMQSLRLSSLRKHFGYVGQNSRLYGCSIAENILAGRSFSKEAVIDLLLSHPIFDRILDLPMGLETFVFPRSYHLSLIQINLIFLARALVHKPAFLFLDEILVGMSIEEQIELADFLGTLSITRILVSHQEMPKTLLYQEISLKKQ